MPSPAPSVPSQQSAEATHVSFPTSDGGLVHADLYEGGGGGGARAVVLAHGGRFDKESWRPQAQRLASKGLRVMAVDFRGYGESRGPGQEDPFTAPLELDLLAGVHWLRANGAASVALVGASMGAGAAEHAAIAEPRSIDRLVLLAGIGERDASKLDCRKLFLVARGDLGSRGRPRLDAIQQHFDRAMEPKELVILEGSAHAQFVFETAEGERALGEIERFLLAP